MTTSAARTRYRTVSGVVVLALVAINVTGYLLHPPWWVRALEGAALLGGARLAGLSWSQLGLGRDRLWSGIWWGLGAITLVANVYVVGILLPPTRSAFQDDRYDLPLSGTLWSAFVVIPLGTVLLEEIAFRSVLWGALARHLEEWKVLGATSVLFGLWHVFPSLGLGNSNRAVSEAVGGAGTAVVVAGTVALTTMGGLVFGELRRRSGSVVAPVAAHWATNALGVLFGFLARRLYPSG